MKQQCPLVQGMVWESKQDGFPFRKQKSETWQCNQAYTGQVCFAFYGKPIAVPLGLRLGRIEE